MIGGLGAAPNKQLRDFADGENLENGHSGSAMPCLPGSEFASNPYPCTQILSIRKMIENCKCKLNTSAKSFNR
ncbi:MAG: hypothetical protein LUE31_09670, partial [Lachnospiraceae bacterium]|nr:hypothetical protein [Lachnospiraceae bacterium]